MVNRTVEMKRSVGKGQIIHTSLKDMTTVISDFPNSEPTPGVLARAVYHHGSQKVVVEIYHESPLIISPGKGTFIDADPSTVDEEVRKLIFSIAERCQTQGEELIQHAQRLLEIASKENLIDAIDEEKVKRNIAYTGKLEGLEGLTEMVNSIRTVSATSSGVKQVKQKSSRVRNDDLLSMLAEDDEEEGEGTGVVESGEVEDVEEEEDTEDTGEDGDLLDCLLEED